MSKKKVKIKSNQGEKIYFIEISGGKHTCYKEKTWSREKIGQSSNMEDAISLIRLHATSNYGGVKGIEII